MARSIYSVKKSDAFRLVALATFRPVVASDLVGFGGINNPETAVIAETEDFVLIVDDGALHVLDENGEEAYFGL